MTMPCIHQCENLYLKPRSNEIEMSKIQVPLSKSQIYDLSIIAYLFTYLTCKRGSVAGGSGMLASATANHAKGQLISKCPFGVPKSTKKKICEDFCHSL